MGATELEFFGKVITNVSNCMRWRVTDRWIPPGTIPDDIPGWPDKFRNDNRLRFELEPSQMDAVWWADRFVGTYGLFPVDMAEKLFKAAPGEKTYTYRYIDYLEESFELYADGFGSNGARIWFSNAALELHDDHFVWDTVKSYDRGLGVGRAIAGSLYSAAMEFGLNRITVATEDIGSFLWAEAGFTPDLGSWPGVKADLYQRYVANKRHMSQRSMGIIEGILTDPTKDNPASIHMIATLEDLVPARVTRDPRNPDRVALGKEMLVGLRWVGGLELSIEAQRQRFEEWYNDSRE